MDNTKKLLRALQAEAMLTESCDLRAYLTGFFSSFGYVYTDWEESVFFTDPRYAEGAKEALKGQDTKVEIAKSAASVFDYIKTKKSQKNSPSPWNASACPRRRFIKNTNSN